MKDSSGGSSRKVGARKAAGRVADGFDSGIAGLPDEGLCRTCRHRRLLRSARSVFLKCAIGSRDGALPRYPRLPVTTCSGFQRQEGEDRLAPGEAGGGAGPAGG